MQNVGTPRIYVDMTQYYIATGSKVRNYGASGLEVGNYTTYPNDILVSSAAANFLTEAELHSSLGLNMGGQITFPHGQTTNNPARWFSVYMPSYAFGGTGLWCGVFGHNFKSIGMYKAYIGFRDAEGGSLGQETGACHQTDPFTAGGEFTEYDGWSIKAGDVGNLPEAAFHHITISNHTGGSSESGYEGTTFTGNPKFNTWNIGTYYDFPHSPDLNLTMSIEMDGITTQQTKGGATLTNARYTGAPKWGDLGAWELGDSSTASTLGARNGRRQWNLTFSYLSDKNVLPINALGNTVFDINSASHYTPNTYNDDGDLIEINDYTGGVDSDYFNSNVLDGEDFFSSVWNKTMGGHLPFIFNPQGGGSTPNNNPDQFAICRFDMNSLQVKQVAFNTYTISLKIRECW